MWNGARAISALFAFLIVVWAILAGVLWAVLEATFPGGVPDGFAIFTALFGGGVLIAAAGLIVALISRQGVLFRIERMNRDFFDILRALGAIIFFDAISGWLLFTFFGTSIFLGVAFLMRVSDPAFYGAGVFTVFIAYILEGIGIVFRTIYIFGSVTFAQSRLGSV
ncbi:MAG: hypothetical protein NUW37_08045 [Planctomycetes bacterium]|nr:hypothetical protein [Planctomycetota bacterium]